MQAENNSRRHAAFRLSAMTLRGVGPYLEGQRLEFRPLTVLCGTNGSGKSTWIRVLNLLRKSSQNNLLPFSLMAEDLIAGPSYTNAAVACEQTGTYGQSGLSEFGPEGTVQLYFECLSDQTLENGIDDHGTDEPASKFLWQGIIPRSTRLRLSFTQRNVDMTQEGADEATVGFELAFDDYLIRCHKKCSDESYLLSCSPQFLPYELQAHDGLVEIGHFCWKDGYADFVRPSSVLDAAVLTQLIEKAVSRFRQVIDRFFSGYFYISAVRVPHVAENLRPMGEKDSINSAFGGDEVPLVNSRWVGPSGEATLALERLFAYSPMTDRKDNSVPTSRPMPWDWPFVFESYVSWWLERLVDVRFGLIEAPNESKGSSEDLDGSNVFTLWGWSLSDSWRKEKRLPPLYLWDAQPRVHEFFGVDFPSGFPRTLATLPVINKWDHDPLDLQRFLHPCFGNDLPSWPQNLSAGFHQIAPAVVQAGLMLPQELMVLENPEVHLHPALQLRFAEFLIEQVMSGRMIVVETHSDLIVRRLIREILHEDYGLGQQNLGLYFVHSKPVIVQNQPLNSPRGATRQIVYRSASLQRLTVDETGHIDNWPAGFLGDDLAESQRLFEVMYGGVSNDKANG